MTPADYPFDIIEAAVSAGHAAYEKVAQSTAGAPHIRRKLAGEEATKAANAALARFASIREALRGSISDKATGPTERVATVASGDAVAEPSRASFSTSLDPFGAAQARLGASANPSKIGRLSENHLDMLERAAERRDVPTSTEALALIAEVRAARASAGDVARLTAERDALAKRAKALYDAHEDIAGDLGRSAYDARGVAREALRVDDIHGGLSDDADPLIPEQDATLREQSVQASREASAVATGTDVRPLSLAEVQSATDEAHRLAWEKAQDERTDMARLTAEVERLKNDLARHDQLYSDRQAELEGQRDTAEAEVERLKCAHSDIATTFHDREVRLTASYEKRVKELLSALDEALDPDVKAIVAERDALAKRVDATLEYVYAVNAAGHPGGALRILRSIEACLALNIALAQPLAADDKAGAS